MKNQYNYWYTPYFNALPTGNNPFTIEMRYANGASPISLSWGGRDASTGNSIGFVGSNQFRHEFVANSVLATATNVKATPNTVVATYQNNTGSVLTARRQYLNATLLPFTTTNAAQPNVTANMCLFVGSYMNSRPCHASNTNTYDNKNLKIQSVRIYNRALTDLEIAQNYAIDEKRFAEPPTVMIGENPCTNIVVISTTKIQCKAPQGTENTTVDVTITDRSGNTETLEQAYTYLPSGTMKITKLDPKVGPSFGGSKIRLTGENLSISKVTIAGKTCTSFEQNAENTTYTCTVPEAENITQDTFVDVVVTPNSGNNYVFAQGFQYIFARKNPVEFNVE
jgi:hypothetical protein